MINVLSIDLDWLQSGYHLNDLNKVFFQKVKKANKIRNPRSIQVGQKLVTP